MIHVPNDVLRRAIILPKDVDTSEGKYASPKDLLPKNAAYDPQQIFLNQQKNNLMKDLIKWQNKLPWRAKQSKEDEEEEGEPNWSKKAKMRSWD